MSSIDLDGEGTESRPSDPAAPAGTAPPHTPSAEEFATVQASPQFQELRSRLRRFVFPMTALFLVWYLSYVLLGAYAHDFMALEVFGNINVGLLLGLGQFVSTFVITALYVRFANRELDPRATNIRNYLEGGQA
jgi:uncharacterized membrane protein (DUF485 family)